MINKESIRPKADNTSDFFSWQLFRWIRKHKDLYRIWETGDEYHPLVIGDIYYGDDAVSGTHLKTLCFKDRQLTVYSFCMFDGTEWTEITDKFWSDYMDRGVCAIHGDNAHQWITRESTRRCEYCNKHERQVVVENKVWR